MLNAYNYAIGVDLGGTNIRVAAVESNGGIDNEISIPTRSKRGREKIISDIVHLCKQIMERKSGKITAIGFGIPGALKLKEGIVTYSPHLPDWKNFPVKEYLKKDLNLPIVIENDANTAAMGEKWQGAGQGFSNLCCLTLGTGIGGGIILDNKIWRGSQGFAGEVGHMTIKYDGILCPCGNRGCLEAYASGSAIKRIAAEKLKNRGDSILKKPFLQNNDFINPEVVYHAAQNDDKTAIDIFREMGRYLGIGIVNITNLLNLDLMIIGGKVGAAWEFFYPALSKELNSWPYTKAIRHVKIVPSQCGDNAGILGAAYLAMNIKEADERF
ncbi:MAG: ROK family protein [Thermodesulfobacteriota bacterium]|nr:ROK family protein [Thermodesulfobacteriota bacterium]